MEDKVARKCRELRDTLHALSAAVGDQTRDKESRAQFRDKYLIPHIPADENRPMKSSARKQSTQVEHHHKYDHSSSPGAEEADFDQQSPVLTERNRLTDTLPFSQIRFQTAPNSAEVRLRLLEASKNQLLVENLELQTKVAVLEVDRSRNSKERRQLQSEVRELKSEVARLHADREELARSLQEETRRAQDLQAQLHALKGVSEKAAALQDDLAELSREREKLVETFSNLPAFSALSSAVSSPAKLPLSRLPTERGADSLQAVASVMGTSPSETVDAVKQMRAQTRVLGKFYCKVKALAEDYSSTQRLDPKQVYLWVKRNVDECFTLKVTCREEQELVEEVMRVYHLQTPQAAIQHIYDMLPLDRSESEKISTGLSFSQSLE